MHLELFADDTAIISEGRVPSAARNAAQQYCTEVHRYLSSWGIKVSAAKSAAVHFAGRRQPVPEVHIQLNKLSIPWQNSIKYLGIVLDRCLTFGQHIKNLKKKANYQLHLFYPILKNLPPDKPKIGINLYKFYIRSILSYGFPIYIIASRNIQNSLHTIQNKLLRKISNEHYTTSNHIIQNLLSVDSLPTYLLKLNKKFLLSLRSHVNPSIQLRLQVHSKKLQRCPTALHTLLEIKD